MTLRNAFANLATENAIRRIATMLNFARDAGDRMRVVVENSSISVYARNSSTNMAQDTSLSYFHANSWNAMDAREQQRINMRVSSQQVKTRWTY